MSRPSSRQNSNADPSGSIEGSGDENGEPSEPTLGRWREASPRARDDKFDRDRDQGGNGDDDGGQSTPDAEEVDRLLRLPDDAEASDSDGDESPGGLATPSGSNRIGGQWESSWGEDGFSPASAGSGWSDSHLTRGQKRRVYGGGRHGEAMQGGGLGAGEVAGLLLAGTLGPTPLLLPHAAALLGLPLFLPLLFLISILSWFSYLVLGVEARYVGARSWPSLTSAVFPHRFKIHRAGELFASLLVMFVSLARGIVGVVAASEVVVDLLIPAGGRRWWERVVGITLLAISWVMVPLVILPLTRRNTVRRRGSFTASTTFSRLPSTITFVSWPLALLILGVRLKSLNQLSPPTTIYARDQPNQGTAMGLSVWSGIAILVFSLSAHQDTFRYITSLARPPSTATRSTRNLSVGRASSETSAAAEFAEGRRNQWPLATALGVGGCSLTQMGWGLVGYLGIEGGGREGNIFASDKLPRDDPWLFTVRLLVLLAIVVGLEGSLETAYGRMRKALGTASLPLPKSPSDRRKSYRAGGSEEDGGSWDWRTALARILVWFVVAGIAVVVTAGGEEGEGLVSVAEIAGCIGSTLLGFLLPSLFFIALFHLRQPRSIFVSDPSAPAFAADTLLMRKEREVQRRLSGRRIWQDVLVFGGLLPFGTVVLVRGVIALATKED